MSIHTLSVLVENKPGVLARVAALFSRRGFNIHSLAVGPTENPDVSRMTIVVNCADLPLEQVTKQLNKLINVLKIVELDLHAAVSRELLLVKVKADSKEPLVRSQILETVELFRAKVVDVATETLTIEATGAAGKARGPDPGPGAVRDQGAGAVRHRRHRPRDPFDHIPHDRPEPALDRARELSLRPTSPDDRWSTP